MASQPNRRRTLRMQLAVNAILSVVLPIVLTGGLALFLLTYHLDVIETSFQRTRDTVTNDIARADLLARAGDTARHIDAFLLSRILEAKGWALADAVVEAARTASARHEAEGLTNKSIDEVENRFRIEKSLGLWPEAESYLRQQVAASPYFAEIFFTDRNGFNVALTNPTSDFVQSDESWWQNAWSQGFSVGRVEYDESAGVWSVDISVRIDQPDAGKPIGVMKTVLAIEPVQEIADKTAQLVPGGRVQISTGRGDLIAETSSGHARERIMNAEANLKEHGDPSVRESFGAQQTGFARDDKWLTGYARTGGRETYATAASRFAGFDWIAIVQKPVSAIDEPITALRSIDDAMRDWRLMLGLAMCAMAILSVVLAVGFSLGAARRYAGALNAIREMAERSARGERVSPAAIENPEEMVRVNEAVHRLSQVVHGSARDRPFG